jgi:polysaccharide pyruvyl transferase WcaK-like protein
MKKNSNYIALIDPALQNNNDAPSFNLGDLIISESISEHLIGLFPDKEIIHISSHVALEKKYQRILKSALLSFIGGTNLMTSDIRGYRTMQLRNGRLVWLFPGINNLILMGTGWGIGYGTPMHWKTKIFYQRILHPDYAHSLRDQYSADKLSREAGVRTINTSCPTVWSFSGTREPPAAFPDTCLFTLTDYNTHAVADDHLLQIITARFPYIVFFPQGTDDFKYLQTLPTYRRHKKSIRLLPHDYLVFKEFISSQPLTYIGTRLHAGIKCLQSNHKVVIIAIDNRASEIAKDIFLPVCNRNDYSGLVKWLEGTEVFRRKLTVPHTAILKWSRQFLS